MKILITGVGVVGKSTLRRLLVDFLRSLHAVEPVEQYDADDFREPRCNADSNCRRPEELRDGVVYVIEDVRGPCGDAAFMPLKQYDEIFYVLPNFWSHVMFWVSRMWRWFDTGNFAWDRDTGWCGTGKQRDPKNIPHILKEFLQNMRYRRAWIQKDREVIAASNVHCSIFRPTWTINGISWDEIS